MELSAWVVPRVSPHACRAMVGPADAQDASELWLDAQLPIALRSASTGAHLIASLASRLQDVTQQPSVQAHALDSMHQAWPSATPIHSAQLPIRQFGTMTRISLSGRVR